MFDQQKSTELIDFVLSEASLILPQKSVTFLPNVAVQSGEQQRASPTLCVIYFVAGVSFHHHGMFHPEIKVMSCPLKHTLSCSTGRDELSLLTASQNLCVHLTA